MSVSSSEVRRCNQDESHLHSKEDPDINEVQRQCTNQEEQVPYSPHYHKSAWNRWALWHFRRTQHPKAECIAVTCNVVAITRPHTEEGCYDSTKSTIEQAESGQHGIAIAVSKDELPLR